MQTTIVFSVISLLLGVGIGYVIAPEKFRDPLDEYSAEVIKKREVKSHANQLSIRSAQMILQNSAIPTSYLTENRSVSDWVTLLESKTNYEDGDWMAQEESMKGLATLIDLIPEEKLTDIILNLSDSSTDAGDSNFWMMNLLCKRWYKVDRDALYEWVNEVGAERHLDRMNIFISAATYSDPDDAINLYNTIMQSHPEFALTSHGWASMTMVQQFAKHRSPEEFWEFYDNLPSSPQMNLFHSQLTFNVGDHESHLEAYKKRNGGELNDSILVAWAKQDAATFHEWYTHSELKPLQQRKALLAMSHSDAETITRYLSEEVSNDPALKDAYLKAVASEFHGYDMRGFKERISKLSGDVTLKREHLESSIESMLWSSPMEVYKIVQFISDPKERFDTFAQSLKKSAEYGVQQFNDRDVEIFQSQLSTGEFTEDEQATLLEMIHELKNSDVSSMSEEELGGEKTTETDFSSN